MGNFKILAVDDDPIILKMLKIIIESEGYQVMLASNGSQAIAALQNEKTDEVSATF